MRARIKGINLLPKEYIQAEKVRMIKMLVGGVLILEVFAFIGGVAIPPKVEAQRLQVELDEVSLKLNDSRFADVNKTIQALEVAKAEVEEWVTKYGNLKQENFVSARVLDSLTARLPMGMVIDKINIVLGENTKNKKEKEIIIEGSSEKLGTIINYVTVLEGVFGTGTVYYEGAYSKELDVFQYKLDIKILEKVEATAEADTTNNGTSGTTVQPEGDTTNATPTESAQPTEGGTN